MTITLSVYLFKNVLWLYYLEYILSAGFIYQSDAWYAIFTRQFMSVIEEAKSASKADAVAPSGQVKSV